MATIQIRKAELRDAGAIAAFNQAMARETEGKALIPEVIAAGVNTLIQNPSLGFYLVAETDEQIVAALMVTMEWSDWRNGLFWWIQSVFVAPAYRRQGIYRQLYAFTKNLADQEPNVCGFRLYVERDNDRAQQTYAALGMIESPYRVFEELKPTVKYTQSAV
ncbi:GNAT family N-acetyltransferase [Leptolyngbya iicbica]|uniref:GNAT family N-acetyltransferase n=2 Tax=Cyanophyceae TaxID=3028117 RepID=A0A4Q7EEX2_9CYAN|nr:GNAT family N-acetyltransferase [Leptolyngbya sp. LK]RZM81743.1 GNAT family N-acetyltransferase [Leptolyngbya sp. LK]